jgi:hypothetical protein
VLVRRCKTLLIRDHVQRRRAAGGNFGAILQQVRCDPPKVSLRSFQDCSFLAQADQPEKDVLHKIARLLPVTRIPGKHSNKPWRFTPIKGVQ